MSFRKSELPRSKSRKLKRCLLLDEVSNEIKDSYASKAAIILKEYDIRSRCVVLRNRGTAAELRDNPQQP
jgi:hypothetical protein